MWRETGQTRNTFELLFAHFDEVGKNFQERVHVLACGARVSGTTRKQIQFKVTRGEHRERNLLALKGTSP